MDHLVGDLAKRLSDDTLLLVLGDHGMTPSGDHGGNSDAERLSALFAYTKRADGFAGTPFDSATTNNGGGSAECRETKREDTMVYYQVGVYRPILLN
jgi:arylsulfatase A-like enzyme